MFRAERCMSVDAKSSGSEPNSGHARSVILFLGAIVALLSAWAVIEYAHNVYLQEYVRILLNSNFSALRLTLIAGFGGTMLSIPLLARLSRRKGTGPAIVPQPIFSGSTRVHPLMLTPRPARDHSFVIRKTAKRGRISRNRGGERLPPSSRD